MHTAKECQKKAFLQDVNNNRVKAILLPYEQLLCGHQTHRVREVQNLHDLVDSALAQECDIIFNLEHVVQLNSKGTSLIMKLMQIAEDKGKDFVCANYQTQSNVYRPLQLFGKTEAYVLEKACGNAALTFALAEVEKYLNLDYLLLSHMKIRRFERLDLDIDKKDLKIVKIV